MKYGLFHPFFNLYSTLPKWVLLRGGSFVRKIMVNKIPWWICITSLGKVSKTHSNLFFLFPYVTRNVIGETEVLSFTFSNLSQDWCWSWNSNTLATWWEDLTHLKRPWCWERLKVGGEGDDRRWDGWMESLTQWTWVWVNSRCWWWTGRPGMLQSKASQRVKHDWVTELNWTSYRGTHLNMVSIKKQLCFWSWAGGVALYFWD